MCRPALICSFSTQTSWRRLSPNVWAILRFLHLGSVRMRRVPCCCRAVIRVSAPRCGSSVSVRRSCWMWRVSTLIFRCFWRRRASVCRMCTMFRRWFRCTVRCSLGRCPCWRLRRTTLRLLRAPCSLSTLPSTSTTAMRPPPNVAPPRCRWTRLCWLSCWVRAVCATCWIRRFWCRLSSVCSARVSVTAPAVWRAWRIFCASWVR